MTVSGLVLGLVALVLTLVMILDSQRGSLACNFCYWLWFLSSSAVLWGCFFRRWGCSETGGGVLGSKFLYQHWR